MMFSICIVALALAQGIQSRDLPSITTFPAAIPGLAPIQTLPADLGEEVVVSPELRPVPVSNPCEACFEYMTSLIEQLAGAPEAGQPEFVPEIVPHPMPEVEVLPEETVPEVEIAPHPIPGVEIAPQPRPLPIQWLRM